MRAATPPDQNHQACEFSYEGSGLMVFVLVAKHSPVAARARATWNIYPVKNEFSHAFFAKKRGAVQKRPCPVRRLILAALMHLLLAALMHLLDTRQHPAGSAISWFRQIPDFFKLRRLAAVFA